MVLLASVSLQCQGALSKPDPDSETDLEYNNLTIEELQQIQENVAHEIQQRESKELEKYFSLISEEGDFDRVDAVKVACIAWSKARSPEQQVKALDFLALLVQKSWHMNLHLKRHNLG